MTGTLACGRRLR
jgi:cold shock protein